MITLKTLPEATAQQVFDQVATHLLTQKQQSKQHKKVGQRDEFSFCAYRGENGLKCAAGCLIADDEYNPEMDSEIDATSWESMIDRELVPSTCHNQLVTELQHLHDNSDPKHWEHSLKDFAKTNNLVYNGLTA